MDSNVLSITAQEQLKSTTYAVSYTQSNHLLIESSVLLTRYVKCSLPASQPLYAWTVGLTLCLFIAVVRGHCLLMQPTNQLTTVCLDSRPHLLFIHYCGPRIVSVYSDPAPRIYARYENFIIILIIIIIIIIIIIKNNLKQE